MSEKKRIAVIGDLIEDVYIYGNIERISPEAPVPVFKIDPLKRVIERDGGAGYVERTLEAFGCETLLICSDSTPALKTRYIANGQQVIRIDNEKVNDPIDIEDAITELKDFKPDAVIFSDYGKGALNSEVINELLGHCYDMPTILDPAAKADYDIGRFFDWVTPNEAEFEQDKTISTLALNMAKTMGSYGALLESFQPGNVIETRVPAYPVTGFCDATGAGDVFVAALTVAVLRGYSPLDCVECANAHAAQSVKLPGTIDTIEPIADWEPAKEKEEKKEIVVFTNGCFDVLHAGHMKLLKEAAKLGDKLVVGLDSDRSVREIKGEGRPVLPLYIRKAALRTLSYVDEVYEFNSQEYLYELIDDIVVPDIIVKGSDYACGTLYGGKHRAEIRLIPLVEGISTTELLTK